MSGQLKTEGAIEAFELNIHSFIIKMWLEEVSEESSRATWRGHITHVPSGARRYLQDLNEIIAFIMPYLETDGQQV